VPSANETPLQVVNARARSRWLRLLLWLGACLGLWIGGGMLGIFTLYLLVKDSVPEPPELEQYTPPITTRVFDQTGILVGEFAVERRDVVPAEAVPRKLVEALIASEDDRFFEHGGIDPLGILRAAIKNLQAGRIVQGGSTLTQQVAKSLIGREKTFTRKFKEAILARRLETKFSKEQILYLYLNQIYLGHGSYGVQAAARNYFHKNVWDLTLPEMATLAGLPQAPSDYDPVDAPAAAKERRAYVLARMREVGAITPEEEASAARQPIEAFPIPDIFRQRAPYYTEEVRRELSKRYGAEGVYEAGLNVETGLDLDWQRAAEEVLQPAIRALDLRQGFRGPLYHFDSDGKKADFLAAVERQLAQSDDLAAGRPVLAVVDEVQENLVRISVGTSVRGIIPVFGMRWARTPDPTKSPTYNKITDCRKVLKTGDVILARKVEPESLLEGEPPGSRKLLPEGQPVFALTQIPGVQGALMTAEPESGYVRAILGGYSFDDSEFNRILQACRQPGSAMKPIIYSLAISQGKINPATVFMDSAEVYDDPENETRWKPDNFDAESKGKVTVHTALVNSMNRVAIKVMRVCGDGESDAIARVIDWAKRLGITTGLKQELGLALGSSCVKPWDLIRAYAVFNRGGREAQFSFIRKVTDRFGRVLLNRTSWLDPFQSWDEKFDRAYDRLRRPPRRLIDADSAYVMTHLMYGVTQRGTAYLVRGLGKPAAGKTGTTNDSTDAWFIGFTRDVITGVWLGYDSPATPLGPFETGARTAVPLWLKYTQRILAQRPQKDFDVPPGITFARIDAATGLLARPDMPNSVLEAFKRGDEPKEFTPAKDLARPGAFFKVDPQY
jgi:penicillin-binding protein 1A